MTKSKKNRKKKVRVAAIDDSVSVDDLHSHLEKLNVLTKEAETAVDTFNYDEAESKLQEILQIDSNNCKCLEMLSSIYIEKFQWQRAQDLLEQCIEISPEVGYSKYFSIAQLYEGLESLKYYEKGIQVLEKELENGENVEPSKEQSKSTLLRNLSDAYCSIYEIYMIDCCFEENAEERCSKAIDLAIKSDPSNPEAYQCIANFQLDKDQIEEAKESMQKSLSLWLPQLEKQREQSDENGEKESEAPIPVYDSRIKTSKLLIELEMYYEASKILNGLLDEDDEVVEVWYLLGWLNYIRGEDEYKGNAHFYLKKAKEVSRKLVIEDDDCVKHVNELLEELSSTHPISDDEEADGKDNKENSESDVCTDSESEENMET